MTTWVKPSTDKADFSVDWSPDLGTDTIASSDWTGVDPAIDVGSPAPSFDGQTTTIWLEGGTAGQTYTFTNSIVSVGGREFSEEISLRVSGGVEALPGFDGCVWPMDPACLSDTWDSYSDDVRQRAVSYASSTLSRLTGYRVGNCPITVLPAVQSGCCYPIDGYWGAGLNYLSAPFGLPVGLGRCNDPRQLILPQPVYRIDEVSIGGLAVDPADYSLQRTRNGVALVYTGTERDAWPTTEEWSVTYLNTAPVDAEGAHAAGILALEFAKACGGNSGKCRLPSNITTIVRQGVSFEMITGAFPDGLTSIREVDNYTAKWNRRGRAPATLIDPGAPDHRVVL